MTKKKTQQNGDKSDKLLAILAEDCAPGVMYLEWCVRDVHATVASTRYSNWYIFSAVHYVSQQWEGLGRGGGLKKGQKNQDTERIKIRSKNNEPRYRILSADEINAIFAVLLLRRLHLSFTKKKKKKGSPVYY